MGNCQAVEAAAMVIQHPSGKLDRMYCPMTVTEVMNMNPGHYVSLIIPLPPLSAGKQQQNNTVCFTRVQLLRPTDTLLLGRAYRLIPSQDVKKVLRAKKQAKMKNRKQESGQSDQTASSINESNGEIPAKKESNPDVRRSRSWRPSLQSISESTCSIKRMDESQELE